MFTRIEIEHDLPEELIMDYYETLLDLTLIEKVAETLDWYGICSNAILTVDVKVLNVVTRVIHTLKLISHPQTFLGGCPLVEAELHLKSLAARVYDLVYDQPAGDVEWMVVRYENLVLNMIH